MNQKRLGKAEKSKKLYQSETSEQVENTKVKDEESLRNSAKILCKATRRRQE